MVYLFLLVVYFYFFTNKTAFFSEDLPAMDQGLSLEVFGLEVQ